MTTLTCKPWQSRACTCVRYP